MEIEEAELAVRDKERLYRRRANARQRLAMRILVIAIVILGICCGMLFVKVQELHRDFQDATNQLKMLEDILAKQQETLGKVSDQLDAREESGESVIEVPQEPSGMEAVETGEASEAEEASQAIESMEPDAAHKVYLTFDDGPGKYIYEILDILDRYEVKATFFVVGKEDEASKEALREIVERGHSLGMHSYSHDYGAIYESAEAFQEDLLKIQDYLYEVTGVKSTLYRFPGGSSNLVSDLDMRIFAECLQENGVTFYDWNISSGDGGSRVVPVEELVENCTKDVGIWDRAVILMHDSTDKQTTVEALPTIIENILAMEDTVILPITENTEPVQHINMNDNMDETKE